MKRIRLGDRVRVISGQYKGSDGAITKIDYKNNTCVVDGVNKHKKHIKKDSKNQESKIADIFLPIHLSNVAVLDEKNHNTPTKVAYRINKQDKKVRVSRKTGNEIFFKKLGK